MGFDFTSHEDIAMFERSAESEAAVAAIVEAADGLDRGDVLTHAAITAATGVRPYEGCWSHAVRSALARIERDRGIACVAVVNVGYRLLTKREQIADEPQRRTLRAIRQLKRGRLAVARVPTSGLPVHLQRLQSCNVQLLSQSQADLVRRLAEHEANARTTPTIERRPSRATTTARRPFAEAAI